MEPLYAPALRLLTNVDGVIAMDGDSNEVFSWEWVVMYLMFVVDREGEMKRGVWLRVHTAEQGVSGRGA